MYSSLIWYDVKIDFLKYEGFLRLLKINMIIREEL